MEPKDVAKAIIDGFDKAEREVAMAVQKNCLKCGQQLITIEGRVRHIDKTLVCVDGLVMGMFSYLDAREHPDRRQVSDEQRWAERTKVANRVYSVSGLTYCSICSGEVEMYDTEEGFVHKGTRTPICSPPKLQYHAPLRDYIVPTESLRDRMAMAALTGLLASFDFIPRSTPPEHVSSMAKFSYLMAEAMLEERVREKTTEGRDQSGLAGSGVRVPIWPSSAETSGGEGDIASKPWPVGRRPPEHD